MQPVDPSVLSEIPGLVGVERFAPYLEAQSGNQAKAVRFYAWNVEASAAFLGAYAALEVGLRNAMHAQLSEMFSGTAWWETAPLSPADRAEVNGAVEYLSRKKQNWTPGHVIAEMKPSFWEGLLVNKYHAALWEAGLSSAFPLYRGRRSLLRQRMERLRLLRNRAAHHEPIFARDLRVDHEYMCDLAGFISLQLQTWIKSHSRLPSVIASKKQTVEGTRPSRF